MSSRKHQGEIRRFFVGRKEDLQRRLSNLSSLHVAIVTMKKDVSSEDTPTIKFNATIRLKNTDFILKIVEEFCDIDISPILYGFQYSLLKSSSETPELLFRYECHPQEDEIEIDGQIESDTQLPDFQNPYSTIPHFHPDAIISAPFKKLHFPFHRQERAGVIFALVAWLEVDLINRYYTS